MDGARQLPRSLLFVALIVTTAAGCVGGESEPEFSPDRLRVDADADSVRNARLSIVNPSNAHRVFEIESSSNLLEADPDRLSLGPGASDHVLIRLYCPAEPGDYEATIEVREADHPETHIVDVDLTCHPSPASGNAYVVVTIDGLPDGERGHVHFQGPDHTEAIATETTTFEEMPAGSYNITASDAEVGDQLYQPDPRQLNMTLWPQESYEVVVEYTAADE